MSRTFPMTLLATALAGALAFGASAQSNDRAAKAKELDAARAELQAAARHVAELSRELGEPDPGMFVFERRALQKPVLGVLLDTDATRGVRVTGVTPGSGAEKAGLRAGDRILGVDGKSIPAGEADARLAALRGMLGGLTSGKAVDVAYERDGRAAHAQVVPQTAAPVTFFAGDGSETSARGDVRFLHAPDGAPEIEAREFTYRAPPGRETVIERRDGNGKLIERQVVPVSPGIAPDVRRDIVRIAREGACRDGERCEHLALAEALRWNGLNLASMDAQLGRYFGTDDGVLVVSAGPELAGLQSGDVIRKVDGRGVQSPRDVMDVLRAKPEGGNVTVDYLRDRKAGTAQLKVPKAMRISLPAPLPPPPPAAPAPPADAPPPPDAPAPPRMGLDVRAPVAPRDARFVAIAPLMATPPRAPLPPPPPPRID